MISNPKDDKIILEPFGNIPGDEMDVNDITYTSVNNDMRWLAEKEEITSFYTAKKYLNF